MLLRNFDTAIMYFNYKSKIESKRTLDFPISGWYKYINGILTALLVIDNNLYFLYGEDMILIKESYKVLLKETINVESEFHLTDEGKILVSISYDLPDSEFNVSPFEYIEEEDLKWEEFIAKIINDKDRRINFILNITEKLK